MEQAARRPMATAAPGDRFGSRTVLVWIALGYIVSAIGSGASWDLGSFVAFRFLGGLAIGGSSVLAPVYIAEVSPAKRRGFLVGLFQLNIVIGILVAYASNFAIGQLAGGDRLEGACGGKEGGGKWEKG